MYEFDSAQMSCFVQSSTGQMERVPLIASNVEYLHCMHRLMDFDRVILAHTLYDFHNETMKGIRSIFIV